MTLTCCLPATKKSFLVLLNLENALREMGKHRHPDILAYSKSLAKVQRLKLRSKFYFFMDQAESGGWVGGWVGFRWGRGTGLDETLKNRAAARSAVSRLSTVHVR